MSRHKLTPTKANQMVAHFLAGLIDKPPQWNGCFLSDGEIKQLDAAFNRMKVKLLKKAKRSTVPKSTFAFLEAHLDKAYKP